MPVTRKKREKVKWRNFSTQSIRKDLVRSLGILFEQAIKICSLESLEVKEREKWMRLSGYLAQTVNTLVRAYDANKIEETLTELEQYVEDNIIGDRG